MDDDRHIKEEHQEELKLPDLGGCPGRNVKYPGKVFSNKIGAIYER